MDNKSLFKQAVKHMYSKNFTRAVDYFKVILSNDENNEEVWVLLGFCQIKMDEFEKAYVSFNNALKINGKHSFAWSGKAYLLFLAGNFNKALLYCDFALNFWPENEMALMIKKSIFDVKNCKDKKESAHNRFDIENILNSFNNQKSLFNEFDSVDLNKNDGITTVSDLNEFKNIFTKKRIKLLKDNPLTVGEYEKILNRIKISGLNNFKDMIDEHDIDLSEISIFKKISLLALAYTDIEYKTKGAEHGSFAFNVIRVDDRLDESNQISTIIHELTHYIFNEIFTQSLMYIWKSDKTDAIEAISAYSISRSKSYKLMNEYCAHTVQGRFLPFGYQNYGSFNRLLNGFDSKNDNQKVKYYLRLGNSIAEDITLILEEFISKKWRDEIKEQFKKDFTNPPKYDGILLETKKTLPAEEIVITINKILSKGMMNIIENDDAEIIYKYKKEYEKSSH